jgi:hypothetical protein
MGSDLIFVARFCGQCSCGCPQLHIDRGAPAERRIVLTDDFGQRVQMSTEQFADLAAWAQENDVRQALA